MSGAVLDQVWDGAGDTWRWMRGVILGEWEDNRSVSQIVTDALAGFVPGLGSIITLRDLVAVIVRLAKHPDKREDVEEWILLVAMLLPLIVTAAGALVAGVGALVGAELGGFLRALVLFLVKKGGVGLKALVEFFQAHGYGDVVQALRQVKFAGYGARLLKGLNEHIDKLVRLVRAFESRLRALGPHSMPDWMPGREALVRAAEHCATLVEQLEALRQRAVRMIPQALIELDQRLAAVLAGDIKAATQVTYTMPTGVAAPEVARLKHEPGQPVMRNPEPPEPGNTRRMAERRLVVLGGRREYQYVDGAGRPVGAKPFEAGVTKMEHPALELDDWVPLRSRVKEGWPNLAAEYKPRQLSTDYATFSGSLRPQAAMAGSTTRFRRVVSHEKDATMDQGAFWNRELPLDGADLRSSSAVKDSWNRDGQFVELRVPPPAHAVWKELHELQMKAAEKAAGTHVDVPYKEELKFWEGPAASQVYEKELADGTKMPDNWYLAGGKVQQFFDREHMAVLKRHGFLSNREATRFPDFDAEAGTIVPKDGPHFEVVPLHEAVPHATGRSKAQP